MRRWALMVVVVLVASGCGWLTRADLRDNGKPPATTGVSSLATNTDGSRTVFVTASKLVPEDTDSTSDIYLATKPGSTVELESGALPSGADPDEVTIDRAGDAFAFVSAARLTPDDTDNRRDVYWLSEDGTLVRASADDSGLFDDITGFDAPQFVADGNGLAFLADDTQHRRHLFVHDLQEPSDVEIPIAAGQDVVQVDGEAQRVVELDADQTIRVVNTETAADLGPDCTGTTPVLGAGPTLVAMFGGGAGCPTGPARFDTVTKVFTPFSVPAEAQFLGLDESEGVLLWVRNDGSQHLFTTSFVTGRTQLVSDTGGLNSTVPALRASLSGDGSTVATLMGVPPSAGTGGALGAYLHTTMPPIASNVSPSSVARGQTVTLTLRAADTFQGEIGASFGPGVDVAVLAVAPVQTYVETVTLRVTVHADAARGPRSLLLSEAHPVGPTFGGCISCLTIT